MSLSDITNTLNVIEVIVLTMHDVSLMILCTLGMMFILGLLAQIIRAAHSTSGYKGQVAANNEANVVSGLLGILILWNHLEDNTPARLLVVFNTFTAAYGLTRIVIDKYKEYSRQVDE